MAPDDYMHLLQDFVDQTRSLEDSTVAAHRALTFEFADLVDEFPVTPEGRGITPHGGAGTVVVDLPKLLVWNWVLAPGNYIGPHWHSCHETILMISGALNTTTADGLSVDLYPGQALTLEPFSTHSCASEGGSNYFVVFHGSTRPKLVTVDV